MNIIVKLGYAYRQIQKPLSYMVLLLIGIAPLTPYKELQLPAIIALGVILLEMLFRMSSSLQRTLSKPENIFVSINTVKPEVEERLNQAIVKNDEVTIQWLGSSLDYAAPFFRYWLERSIDKNTNCKIKIEVAGVNEEYSHIDNLNYMWKSESKSSYSLLSELKKSSSIRYGDKVSINIIKYDAVPCVTGILINHEVLFESGCSWKESVNSMEYSVGNNEYYLFSNKDNVGKEKISQYIAWFDFYRRINCI